MTSAVLLPALLALLALLAPAAARAALPPGTSPVPPDVQELIENALAAELVLPESAIWDFRFIGHFPGGGDIVCGFVNYQSAGRHYEGPKHFYAILDGRKIEVKQLEDPPALDASGQQARKFKVFCDDRGK